jgi:hypothetical protein
MQVAEHRKGILAVALLVLVAAVFAQPAMPQDPMYHQFADGRSVLGIPNGLNVLSNLPFLLVGIAGCWVALGIRRRATPDNAWLAWPYLALFLGTALTTFGSAYYHLAPDNPRLVWDRLPMTLGFMGLLSAMIGERVGLRLGRVLLGPLLLLGLGSVWYWQATERLGRGDLRPYLLVQFGSLALVLLLLILYPARYTHTGYLWAAVAAYAAAKLLEAADHQVFAAGYQVSGHTLKHLAAAASVACIVRMLQVRTPVASGTLLPTQPAPVAGANH